MLLVKKISMRLIATKRKLFKSKSLFDYFYMIKSMKKQVKSSALITALCLWKELISQNFIHFCYLKYNPELVWSFSDYEIIITVEWISLNITTLFYGPFRWVASVFKNVKEVSFHSDVAAAAAAGTYNWKEKARKLYNNKWNNSCVALERYK